MNIEHVTFGGSSLVLDTNTILPETIEFFKPFQVKTGNHLLSFPETELSVNVTIEDECMLFSIHKNDFLAIANVCCFEGGKPTASWALCEQIAGTMPAGQLRKPTAPNWLYSFIINPIVLSPDELILAGEVEFYICYSLFLGRP